VPAGIVRALARLALGDRADSLLGDAAYDGARFARDFCWSPPVDFETALARTVAPA
jgi:UDP-glucose 4-epimerase